MTCVHPIYGYWSRDKNEKGNPYIVFDVQKGYKDRPVILPCGKCIGCLKRKCQDWSIRCYHESKMHKSNLFITLTINEKNNKGSLDKKELKRFIRRLAYDTGHSFRYFASGEYSPNFHRPHYHILCFGLDLHDMVLWKIKNGNKYFISATVEKAWEKKGWHTIGEITPATCTYVGKYITKKYFGKLPEGYEPEFIVMSRRPGIGHNFIAKYTSDIYNIDAARIDGSHVYIPPKYYDRFLAGKDGDLYEQIKKNRVIKMKGIKIDYKREENYLINKMVKSHKRREYEKGN